MVRRTSERVTAAPLALPWRGLAFVAVVAVVAVTCAPIFQRPALDPDDWRYLALVKEVDAGHIPFLGASIVENRWDHLWWLDAPAIVRFFRPTVLASYWVDAHVWGERVTTGLLATNVLVHLACALLVAALLLRWLGAGIAALVSSALFAAFWAHGEAIWYVAGRTDSMAALAFLLALFLHAGAGDRPWRRAVAVPVWAVGLLTKETVVALPALLFLHDLWMERRADTVRGVVITGKRLWIAYAVAGTAVLGLRALALGDRATAPVYPYLVPPTHPAFPGHLWTQARIYAENLLLATESRPFLDLAGLSSSASTLGLVLTVAALATVVVLLRRELRFRWAVAITVLTWLPASVSYVSERYLYLPSVGVALCAGLVVGRFPTGSRARAIAAVVVALWAGHQASMLRWKHEQIMVVNPRVGAIIREKLAIALRDHAPGERLLLVNLPGDWLEAQFAESLVRDLTDDPTARVRVLTQMPLRDDLGVLARIVAEGEHVLKIEGGTQQGRSFPAHVSGPGIFPAIAKPSRPFWREALGFSVDVDGDGTSAHVVRVTIPEGVAGWKVLRWLPDLSPGLTPRERYERGRFERVPLP